MKTTEQSSLYSGLDAMSTEELLRGINAEDSKVPVAVAGCIPQISRLVDGIVERMKRGGRVFYTGAGTSGRLGITDASEILPTYGLDGAFIGIIAGGDGAIRRAVEGAEDDPEQGWKDVLAFGCNEDSPVASAAEMPIVAVVGPEFVTGSTRMKAGTATKLILNMISTSVMIRLGHVKGNHMVDMQLTNKKLVDRGTRMIMEEAGVASYDEARALLLKYGSVRAAVESLK